MAALKERFPALFDMHDAPAPPDEAVPWERVFDGLSDGDTKALGDLKALLDAHPMSLRRQKSGDVDLVADPGWRAAHGADYLRAAIIVWDLAAELVRTRLAPHLPER